MATHFLTKDWVCSEQKDFNVDCHKDVIMNFQGVPQSLQMTLTRTEYHSGLAFPHYIPSVNIDEFV